MDGFDSEEREIPSGWRQLCSQGHRSGLAKKCKMNNHGSNFISPDGGKYDDLESVYQFLYGAKGDIWQPAVTSLEELDETQIKSIKRQRLENENTNKNAKKKAVIPRRSYPSKALIKCGKCTYSFMSQDHLITHIKNKHIGGGLNPIITPLKFVSKWAGIMNTAMDKTPINQKKYSSNDQDEIIIDDIIPVKKTINIKAPSKAVNSAAQNTNVNFFTKLGSNISVQMAKPSQPQTKTSPVQTFLTKNSGISIKLNQYPKIDAKVLQSTLSSKLPFTSSTTIVKAPTGASSTSIVKAPTSTSSTIILKGPTSTSSTTIVKATTKTLSPSVVVSVTKETISINNILNPKITKVTLDKTKLAELKRSHPPLISNLLPEKPKSTLNSHQQFKNVQPEKNVPEPVLLSRPEDQELAQQEMLFLVTPLKCYFCELGRTRMNKSDPADFFHLQLEMNNQIGKGNPSNRDVENLATYLRVNIGIARKVLQHIGVTNQTKDSKNRLSFIRRLCWDNMESLQDLCNSFEQVWRCMEMNKDTSSISQEILGQVYRWKFLFKQDSYYQTFMNQVFIHIHQGTDSGYSFMRNKIVDIEID